MLKRKYIYRSLGLHFAVLIAFTLNFAFFLSPKTTSISQVPIIVDLKNVKISEITNLPPKAKISDEDREATVVKQNKAPKKTTKKEKAPTSKPEKKAETKQKSSKDEVVPEPKEDFLVAPKQEQGKKDSKPKPISVPKPLRKPQAPKTEMKAPQNAKKADEKTPELAAGLSSLLASVDSIQKKLGEKEVEATIKEGTPVSNQGIEGGTGGSYFSELSISEIDAIAGRIRACWNLDPGAKGAQNMIVDIRVYLKEDSSVKDVKVIDMSRYNSDPHFRSIADSARRAVYICSPYSVFADKYADKYDMWSTILLKFNPLDGNVN